MSPSFDENEQPAASDPREEAMARLIRAAGTRPSASEEVVDEVTAVARDVWRAKVASHAEQHRAQRSSGRWLAIAAGLILAAGLLFLGHHLLPSTDDPATATAVATVERVADGVRLVSEGSPSTALQDGDMVRPGATLDTGEAGRVALRLDAGSVLRLDVETRLELRSATVFRLASGAIYFDSGGAETATAVAIHTPFGIAHDIGTQFEARLMQDGLQLRVREGEVRVDRDGVSHHAPAGTVLTVGGDGTVDRSHTRNHGEDWQWVLQIAPTFELEGRSLDAFLTWVCRESGWRLRYADAELAQRATSTTAHGSISGLTPAEALAVVVPGSGLTYRIEDGTLHIEIGP